MKSARTSQGRKRRSSRQSTGSQPLLPDDPIVSVYPLPLDGTRARDEAARARRLGKKLPVGHPYRRLPLWVPYGLGRLINRSAASSRPLRPGEQDESDYSQRVGLPERGSGGTGASETARPKSQPAALAETRMRRDADLPAAEPLADRPAAKGLEEGGGSRGGSPTRNRRPEPTGNVTLIEFLRTTASEVTGGRSVVAASRQRNVSQSEI